MGGEGWGPDPDRWQGRRGREGGLWEENEGSPLWRQGSSGRFGPGCAPTRLVHVSTGVWDLYMAVKGGGVADLETCVW